MAALAAPPDPAVEALLGVEGARRLRATLAARARRWAALAAPGVAFEATTLGAAVAALRGHAGPVLLAAPDVPGLDGGLVRAALDDLAWGCDVVLGAAYDARPYLVAVPRVDSPLLDIAGASFSGGLLAAFAERRATLGLLRSERRLASRADVRALALDPLAPTDLVAVLRGAG